jgi:prolyl oligopeptidase PreP (S9A serine peptidase family)
MARGDSISLNSPYNNANVAFYMQPSSGDEWMITALGCNQTTQYLMMTSSSGGTQYMHFKEWDTDTLTNQFMKSDVANHQIKWFVTNSVYIRTSSGWAYTFWMMGIKTKE